MSRQFADASAVLQAVAEFAARHIAPRRRELISAGVPPADLWEAFSASGLAGLSIPEEFGGHGAGYRSLSQAIQVVNRFGGVPGVGMIFMVHWLGAKLHIAGDTSTALKERLLPRLARGEATLSVAISEPGAGAHPKHLKTTARREGDEYVINGEKAFLTNGPLAGYFVVLAITSEREGRKEFSALLVPADTPGLTKTDGVKIDFLHPCPHGGIRMENVRVPAANLIGAEGDAFQRTSLRMRAIEDAAGAGGRVGSMSCLLSDIAAAAPDELDQEIGAVATQLQALAVVAAHLAAMADAAKENVDPLLELHLGFHQQAAATANTLAALLEKTPARAQPEVALLCRDVVKSLSIAKNALAARHVKTGRTIIAAAKS